MKGHSPIRSSISYAKGLAEYGFNYHSVIRPQYKINHKRLDWYMNNLVRSKKVDIAFACLEPDMDKYSCKGEVQYHPLHQCKPYGYNHIHFAYKGKAMTRGEASRIIRCKQNYERFDKLNNKKIVRPFLLDIMPIYNGMDYFTKHLGKSLSYHNIYV